MNQKLLICFIIIIIVIFIISNNSELFSNTSSKINLMKDGEQYDLFTFTQLTTNWRKSLLKYISSIDKGTLLSVIHDEYDVIKKFTDIDNEVMPTHDFVFAIKYNANNAESKDIITGNIEFNSNNEPTYSNSKKVLTINNNILVATEKSLGGTTPVVLLPGNQISNKFIELIDFTINKQSIFIIKLVDNDNGVTITKT